jgi:endonuclease/exonuclease/phosphatase (EEP) superfamily protein YafD
VWATIFAFAVCLPTLAAAFAGVSWMADLLASFRVQTFWISLAAAVVLLLLRRRWPAAAVLAAAAWNAALIAPCYFPANTPDHVAERKRILYANVHVFNRDRQKLLDLIEAENPDTIVIVEATPEWVASLGVFYSRYPTRHEAPQQGVFGMAMYSRLPLEIEEIKLGKGDANIALLARYDDRGQTVNILAVHPPPPISPSRAENRNAQIMNAASLARGQDGESMVIGDMNVTPWSPVFREALDAGGLGDSRRGFGIQPSWPADRWLLRIPIDHCLVTPGVAIHDRRIGSFIGSDHLPLVIDYSIASKAK